MAFSETVKSDLEQLRHAAGNSVLIVAIGNTHRSDDAAGIHLARNIAIATGWDCIECDDVPENYTFDMRTHAAQTILFVDAVDMGAEPGTISIINPDELAGETISTHKPSLRLLAKMLREQANKYVLLLGIQPVCIQFGVGLSLSVAHAVDAFTAT